MGASLFVLRHHEERSAITSGREAYSLSDGLQGGRKKHRDRTATISQRTLEHRLDAVCFSVRQIRRFRSK